MAIAISNITILTGVAAVIWRSAHTTCQFYLRSTWRTALSICFLRNCRNLGIEISILLSNKKHHMAF